WLCSAYASQQDSHRSDSQIDGSKAEEFYGVEAHFVVKIMQQLKTIYNITNYIRLTNVSGSLDLAVMVIWELKILFVQMSGKWYLAGFATNAQWFLRYKGTMGMGTAMFNAVDGDLDMPFESLNPDGSCFRMHNLAKKTDVPGKFSRGSLNDMRIVDVKYDEYALVYTVKTIGDSSDAVIKAYGRAPELSTEVQEKFRQFASENGVLPENIVILPKNSDCPSE
uniref:Zgc:153704 n=1 Tax=Neogobius melanostomus TaxID=47308 RepID=A0A8C6WK45_9GOBI